MKILQKIFTCGLITAAMLTGFALTANAQVVEEWVARYNYATGNSAWDVANSLAVDADGNVYVTGRSYGTGTDLDYATIKYNSSGQEQWVARYNGPENGWDDASALAVDAEGNVYVTGRSYGTGTYDDYATIKYNSSGQEQWVARYNGPGNGSDYASALAVDADGNVYVTGRSYGAGTDYDYATIKYNSSGQAQWVARYNYATGDSAWDVANSLAVDADGNVYVTGRSYGAGTFYDYATIKYNSSGQEQWVARYNGPGNGWDGASSLAVDADGNVYVTGESLGAGTSYDYATIKYNSSGQEQWVARYNGPGNGWDDASALAVDADGNVYVTGESAGTGIYVDYATIKYNSSGQEQWVARYNGPGNGSDYAYSLAVDADGNVYVTGKSTGTGTYYDYATIKYNSSGQEQWEARYNGPGNDDDYAYALAVDAEGNVYVTGRSYGIGTDLDYATIKYHQTGAGVEEEVLGSSRPEEFMLYPPSPNPFNPTTAISYKLQAASFVNLSVYDLSGSKIAELVNGWRVSGPHEVIFDGSHLASGIYLCRLQAKPSLAGQAGEFEATGKLVLMK